MPRREHPASIAGIGDGPNEPPVPSCICPACGKGYRNEDPTCGRADCEDALNQAERLLGPMSRGITEAIKARDIGSPLALRRLRYRLRVTERAVAAALYELS